MRINDVIVKPKITEKALQNAKNMVYTFEVSLLANKIQIQNAVESLFNVKVGEVKTVIQKGKETHVGRRRMVKRLPHVKIAYVKVIEGKIELFPKT